MNPRSSLTRHYRPSLETLEGRLCPACIVTQRGGTLQILGDKLSNQVTLADTAKGEITVTCDGSVLKIFPNVNNLDIKLQGGNDVLSMNLVNHHNGQLKIRSDLGDGNDKLAISGFDPQPDPPIHSIVFTVFAGAGNDDVTFMMSDPNQTTADLKIDLGAGDDEFMMNIDPGAATEQSGRLNLDVTGGAGKDCFELELADTRTGLRTMNARLDLNFTGGANDDEFMMDLGDVTFDGGFMMDLDGGADREAIYMNLADVRFNRGFMMNTALGAGNDQFQMNLSDVTYDGNFMMRNDLGSGNDGFMMNLGDLKINHDYMMSVAGGAGIDRLDLRFIDPTPAAASDIRFSLDGGAGNDLLAAQIKSSSSTNAAQLLGALKIDLAGGGGNDQTSLDAQGLDIHGAVLANYNGGGGGDKFLLNLHEDVRVFGLLDVSSRGGSENDILDADIVPCLLQGRLNFYFDGQNGQDRATVHVHEDDDDVGAMALKILGGAGNDNLTLILGDVPPTIVVTHLLDGGLGTDVANITPNLTPVRCEKINFVSDPH